MYIIHFSFSIIDKELYSFSQPASSAKFRGLFLNHGNIIKTLHYQEDNICSLSDDFLGGGKQSNTPSAMQPLLQLGCLREEHCCTLSNKYNS